MERSSLGRDLRSRFPARVIDGGTMPQGLGEFEQMVLLAILHVEGEAYGVPIVEEIEGRTGRTISRAAVYVTLRRLEKRGLVTSWMGEPTGERGGKARRCVRVEPEGVELVRESRRAMERMWDDLEPGIMESAR
jgi:DNA-binding PadR family transcriptional regulator